MQIILVAFVMTFSFSGVLGWEMHRDPDIDLTLDVLVKKFGFDGVKLYYVTTIDGYILTIVRIKQKGAENLQPIIMVHGLSACAETYFAAKEKSPPVVFGKAGYDVWIMSSRGTNYSRNHTRWNASTDKEYWMFSWQEIGLFDLPKTIDTVLSHNVHDKVILLGHSEGTTVIFVTLADAPGYDQKTLISIHWGLSVYHDDCIRNSGLSNACKMEPLLSEILDALGFFNFFPTDQARELLIQLCTYKIFEDACREFASLYLVRSQLMDQIKSWDFICSKAACGGSSRELFHFMQIGKTGRFARYDYGPEKNLRIYNSTQPPLFHLENILSPTVLWCGISDPFCSIDDVKKLKAQLKNVESIDFKGKEVFTHNDFLLGVRAQEMFYDDLFKILQKYCGTGDESSDFH